MSRWVALDKKWLLRPTQDGLELLTPERNIALELSEPERRDEIVPVLLGEVPIPDTEEIKETISDLIKQGVLQYSNCKPQQIERVETAKQIWKLWGNMVGSRGPIYEVYWLDPTQSQFSPIGTHLFTAKYQENIENIAWAFASDQKDRNLAELKAIMEALERYACGVIPFEEFVRTSAKKLGKNAIDPRKVISYTRKQYRNNPSLLPFSNNREYYWKEVMTFPGREKRYLPADCLYFPLDEKIFPHPYTVANSSGVAAGFNLEETLLRGLYEAIERDAFMIVWLRRITMPTIQKTSLSEDIQNRVRQIEELGYQVFFINITLDLAPVMLVVVVSYQREPALILGTASNLDILVACSKALAEVEQQLYWSLKSSTSTYTLSDYKKVKRVSDHAALYHTSQYLPKASFLWSGESQLLPTSPKIFSDELERIVNIFNSHKSQIIIADLTPPSFKKSGVQVIKAIPLGLVPISFGYGMEPLGMPRFKRPPKRITSLKQNPWPHNVPFTHPFA